MDRPPTTHETAVLPDEMLGIKTEVAERLSLTGDLGPECLAAVQGFTDVYWQQLIGIINDPNSLDAITDEGWAESFTQTGTEATLNRLASIKAALPDDNAEKQRNQHNISLENHVKLALEAAEDIASLRIFGEVVRAKIMHDDRSQLLAQQALFIWAPAAEIAGLHELRTELEEAAFERLYPAERSAVVHAYADLGGDEALAATVEGYKAGIMAVVEDELDAPDATLSISGRRKAYFSVWRKVTKDRRPSYRLSDFIGMRIVVDSEEGEAKAVEHCYSIANIVSKSFTPEPGRYKDYVMNPKANGYQSLHMTVVDLNGTKLEFQIRTQAMHDMAEFDPNVSHMAYDASSKLTPGKYFGKQQARPERVYGWRDQASAEIRKRRANGDTNLRDLQPGKVMAFSEDGNLYQFNAGDTLLDFAFAVHTQRVLSLQYIFRRGQLAKFEQPVNFADVVGLKYHPNKDHQTWAASWFDTIRSSSARRILRKAEHKRHRATFVGRAPKLIEREVKKQFRRRLGRNALKGIIPMLHNLDDEQREEFGARYGLTFEQALVNIGSGAFKPGKAARYLAGLAGVTFSEKEKPARVSDEKDPTYYKDQDGRRWEIAVQGVLGYDHHLAQCCDVHVGDSLVAVPSRIRGTLSIHTYGCVNLPPEEDKLLECSWEAADGPHE